MAQLSEVTIVIFSIHRNFIALSSLPAYPAHCQRVAPGDDIDHVNEVGRENQYKGGIPAFVHDCVTTESSHPISISYHNTVEMRLHAHC